MFSLSRISIANLPFTVSERDIRAVFERFGAIHKVEFSRDPIRDLPNGVCFLEVEAPVGSRIVEEMDGADFCGRAIQVRVANPDSGISDRRAW
jgi:RNA recognition motif-containing protein